MSAQDLYVEDRGAGEAVLFVHAFPFDGRIWEHQRDALAASYRVLVPDLRGFGRSRGLKAPQSLDAHADDLAALLDRASLSRATLVGLSMGGYISLAFARRYPERLARLVLADTRATPDSPEARARRERDMDLVVREGVSALVDALLPRLLAPGADRALISRVRDIAASQSREAVLAALVAMRDRPDSTPVLASLHVPLLVLVGAHDVLTPPEEARAMASVAPRARVVEIPGAGHLSSLEAPEAFTAALESFLREPASG